MKTVHFIVNNQLELLQVDASFDAFPKREFLVEYFNPKDINYFKEAFENKQFTSANFTTEIQLNHQEEQVRLTVSKFKQVLHIHLFFETQTKELGTSIIHGIKKDIIDNSSTGIVIHSKTGEIIEANNAAQEILGLSFDQLYGKESADPAWRAIKSDSSIFPGDEHPAMVALKSGKKVNNVEMGIYHPQKKEIRWIHINATPVYLENRKHPDFVYVDFIDISETKEFNTTLNDLVSDVKNTKQKVKTEIKIRETLLKISNDFINSHVDHYDLKINNSLQEIGLLIDADLIGVFHYEESITDTIEKNSWKGSYLGKGILFSKIDYEKSLAKHSKHEDIKLYNSGTHLVATIDEIETLQPTLKSLYTFPYFKNKKCIGYLQVEFHQSPKDVTEQMEKLISLFLKALSEFEIKKELNTVLDRNSRIINHSHNEIYICNASDFKFLYANNSALSNIGYTMTELLQLTPLDFKPTNNKDEFLKLLKPLFSGEKELIEFETIHTRKNGSTYPILINLQYFSYENDHFITAIARDITQEKLTQKRNKKNKLLIQSIFSQVNIPMIITSVTNDYIVDANQAAEELFGFSKDKILKLNQNVFNISKELVDQEIDTLKKKYYFHYETEQTIKGVKRILDVHSSLIEINNTQFIYKLIFDQTEAKNNLKRIIHQNDILKNIAWSHSHQLRAPLSRLLTLSEIISSEDYHQSELPDFMRSIKQTAIEIDKVIHDINGLTNESKMIENQIKHES